MKTYKSLRVCAIVLIALPFLAIAAPSTDQGNVSYRGGGHGGGHEFGGAGREFGGDRGYHPNNEFRNNEFRERNWNGNPNANTQSNYGDTQPIVIEPDDDDDGDFSNDSIDDYGNGNGNSN